MIDPKLLRNNQDLIKTKLSSRGFNLDIEEFNDLEQQRKLLQTEIENLRYKRNYYTKIISFNKRSENNNQDKNNQTYKKLIFINKNLDYLKIKFKEIKQKILNFSLEIPNIPIDDVPVGKDSNDNIEISKWGEIPKFNFLIKDHVDLGELTKGLDFKTASIITGKRFVTIKGQMARLYRALSQFMIDLHVDQHNYIEIHVPLLVNQDTLYNTGHLPKFSHDLFHIKPIKEYSNNDYSLIPTAEVPLTNLVKGQILSIDDLPIKFVSCTPCFRSEAGSYGCDTRGLIRMHQFDKVELVQIVTADKSIFALEELVSHAEKVLILLKLPYRKIILCTGDLGFSSAKTYDLEVWFPSQNKYREVSSCSNMLDFQSRRMKTRYYLNEKKAYCLVHTLNGSGLAIGRTLASILENYQHKDGYIIIPEILKPYMNNLSHINFI